MKLKAIQELGERLNARFPSLWEYRLRLAVCILMFLIFFGIHRQALRFPETLRNALNASSLVHVSYSNAVMHIFPPELEISGATLGGPALRGAVLRFDKVTVRPLFWRLLTVRAGMRLTALAGAGSATLEAATGVSFDFTRTSFSLDMENMPLRVLEALEQFDPDADGAVSAQARGEIRWIDAAGLIIPRDCEIEANGRITLPSARNGLAALTFERFRNGVFHFDLAVSGRVATIRRMDFTDQSCGAALSGKAVIDWRNVADSELNLTAEAKAKPEYITPALMNEELRRRLEQGQSLPFVIQGTLSNVQMKPVL